VQKEGSKLISIQERLMNRSKFVVVGVAALLVCGFSSPLSLMAQEAITKGTVEIAGSAGFSAGVGSVDRFTDIDGLVSDLINVSGGNFVSFDPGSKTKWNIGASGGYAITPDLMLVGDIVRTRLANPILSFSGISSITSLEYNASLLEVTAGAEYNVPLRNSKIIPFAGLSFGLARSKLALKDSTFNILDVDVSDNHFTANFGGGARVYLSSNWGLRPELRIVHIPNETFVRLAAGVFVQFGK
jgi:hypothetical protein